MKVFQQPVPVQAVLLAMLLAVPGLALVTWASSSFYLGLFFSLGVLLGGIVVPLLVQSPAAGTLATTTLYVGNLPYRANEATVRSLFEEFGQVLSVRLMKDRQTGKRRGFGFVEMPADAAEAARTALNDTEFQQRTLKVREANERKDDDGDNEAAS
ncbi:RNA-binding protein [Oceanimonas sp. NS1]|uniref:RNA-binding protein n=1 Tax=Oceanimonas doudoroffii TaxID=84158 RepID=A0A233RDL0_9GAMM|nr:RNA-binding protein [Oceanimonas doudoroffii]MCT7654784.1 RNA-binding protein [Oceanimonas sp. NS1]OXY81476.1 RNA-binding protein [Oceanimonas doudoroffii]